ncbi:MAG: ATP-dependent RNA helicase HrpA, partial [Gammaproteobacteria bacterium]|nr:ATP-dependent RNA helicase HrpA [Gammaproteobacteria bacterium]
QAAIVHAVHELGAEGPGDILVFLPGERDIRNTAGLLRKRKPESTEILPLYARLSAADQRRIFKPHTGQRIVLATNVAETSLTVPGIRYVIDAGYARISRYTTSRQVQRLPVEPVSQASADQRAGRCGRTAPGICIRLYAEDDYLTRPRFTDPEVLRSSLAGVILMMRHLGLGDVDAFPFLDPPMSKHINDGYRLLLELGAVDENRALTPLGRRLARFPVDPRLGRMLLAAERIGCLSEVLTIAAALAVQDPRETPESARREAQQHHRRYDQHGSDFIALLALWSDYQSQTEILSNRELRRYCKQNFLSFARMGEWRDVRRQLAQVSREMELARNQKPAKPDDIHRALLSGLLGNIATLDEKHAYVGTYQKKLFVHPSSSQFNRTPKWIMAAELVDTSRLYARVTAPIKPEWVEPFAGHLLRREYLDAYFESKSGRVMAYERATLFGLTVISRRKTHLGPREPSRAREILIREGLVEGRLTNGGAFLDHNRDLIARASQLENKVRRRDIVIDTEALFEFYDERLPPELFSAARLERWRRTAEADMPRLLYLKRADVLKRGAEKVTLERFPDTIDVNGNRLPLNYHFAPGHPNDGVTVTIPLALLNQLPAGRFTWVVPGLLHEKVIALIKSLPKPIRRRLVPAPEFAARSIEMLSPGDTPITAALADILQRLAGVTITPADWDLAKLPPHLVTSFHLVDERGATVAYGRDLAALRALHQDSAETHFSQSAGN